MELRQKLEILADAAKYDASCASSGSKRASAEGGIGATEKGICHSYTPDGRCVSLLKILLTNFCVFDCQYCVNRISSDVARAAFTPAEVVRLTLDFYRRNYIEGLFLSSGVIKSPDYTMELLVEVARTLRQEHKFGGYIHLKAVAGASQELLLKAGTFADRLSANIELPTAKDLATLAPQKTFVAIEKSMAELATRLEQAKAERVESARAPSFIPAGQSTQMIVGATPSADGAILRTADSLYRKHGLRRVYYSAFSPIPSPDVRLPLKSPPLVREHRLYQADWLMRFYGFRVDELVPDDNTELSLEIDPKLAWALRRRDFFPVDVNTAPKEDLLRVPGLGVRSVQKILRLRRWRKLTLTDLGLLHVSVNKTKPFVVTQDHRPTLLLDRADLPARAKKAVAQLELFDAPKAALSGEL